MGNKLTEWYNLVARVADIHLQDGRDIFAWPLHKNVFSQSIQCISISSIVELELHKKFGKQNYHLRSKSSCGI